MPYSEKAVANYFIDKALETETSDLSPMKLQKLVYFAHAWHLAYFEEPLITSEIQAWKYGPVIPDLYHEIKEYGTSSITARLIDLEYLDDNFNFLTADVPENDLQTHSILDAVWNLYGHFSPIQLSNMTHEEGEPWSRVIQQSQEQNLMNLEIPNNLIQEIFRAKLHQHRGE